MSENIKDIMGTTMDKVKSMASADVIIGDPMKLGDSITAVPISKVSYGFASGGSDFPSKTNQQLFGGGGGAGMSITPIAFLVIQNDNVKILPISTNPDSVDKAISLIPDIYDRAVALFSKDKKQEKSEA
jgi:sporulation protein YtfJ